MDILLLTPDNPAHKASGAALRNYGIIRGLHGAGHRVNLLTFSEADVESDAACLSRYCHEVTAVPIPRRSRVKRALSLLTSRRADIEFRLDGAEFRDKLEATLDSRNFDVIQFSGIELGCALNQIQQQKRSARVVYDALNAEAELQSMAARIDRAQISRLPAAWYSATQARRLLRFEREICQAVDAVIAVSDDDSAQLSLHKGAPIFLIPNGIYAAEYTPASNNTRADNHLVFTGKMDYRPNVDAVEWFCSAILPMIRGDHPRSRLLIVGRNPHQRVQSLAATQDLEITGWVDSVLPYLQAATVYIVPLRMGSGTRLKILEAMAAG